MIDPITQHILDEQEELKISKYVMEVFIPFFDRNQFRHLREDAFAILPKDVFDRAVRDEYLKGLKTGFESGEKAGGYQAGVKVGTERGLRHGVEQGIEQGVRQGTSQGVEQGKRETMTLFAVVIVVAVITAVGVTIYQNFYSKAARACENKKGKEKRICMLKYRMEGLTKKAAALSGNARAYCKKSKNAGKCKAIIAKKVNSINDDVKKIKYKIQKMA